MCKFRKSKSLLLFLGLIGSWAVCPLIGAADLSATFVDLDGDGIDDQIQDQNNDGIPDRLAHGYVAPKIDADKFALNVPASSRNSSTRFDLESETRSQKFGKRFFFARGIESCRTKLESGFGTGVGIGLKGGGGGACAGGVCF